MTLLGARLVLDVGAVAHGGHCVARHEGRVVFVRHALPGERVEALVTEDDGGAFCRADAVAVLDASPDRVPPPCPFAGPDKCGGCDFQHAAPAAQRGLKATVVREQLVRLGGLVPDAVDAVFAGVAELPGGPLGWRTRVRFAVDDGRPGLRKHRSHEVIPVDGCLIAHPSVAGIGVLGADWPGADAVEAVASSAGDRAVVASGAGVGPPDLPELPDDVAILLGDAAAGPRPGGRRHGDDRHGDDRHAHGGSQHGGDRHPHGDDRHGGDQHGRRGDGRQGDGRRGRGGRRRDRQPPTDVRQVRGHRRVREDAAGRRWLVHADGFWQVHPAAADTFVGAVLDLLAPREGERAVDLYAGAGLFTAALAAAVGPSGTVTSVEGARTAVADARRNLRDLANVDIRAGAVRDVPAADLVVLDPPRTGAGAKVVANIVAAGPRAIAYVACDPAALARDVATFRAHGYRLDAVRGFDAFPMTHHVECVALLTPAVTRHAD